MITLESITKKLGFDPSNEKEAREYLHKHCPMSTDANPSPWKKLDLDEFNWLEKHHMVNWIGK